MPAHRIQFPPPAKFFWFLPTNGDSRWIVGRVPCVVASHRPRQLPRSDSPYLAEVAQAADRLGYDGMLTPSGTGCEDAWLATAALLPSTERLKFLVAFRPGSAHADARGAEGGDYQRISDGRLLVNIVTGGETEQRALRRLARTTSATSAPASSLRSCARAVAAEPFDFKGQHYEGRGRDDVPSRRSRYRRSTSAARRPPPSRWPPSTSTSTWRGVSRRHGGAACQIDSAQARGRAGADAAIRDPVPRDLAATEREAWAVADQLLGDMAPDAIAAAQADCARRSRSVGQQRMAALHGGDRDELVCTRTCGPGSAWCAAASGTALVGSYDEVADRIAEYHALGFDEFILSGYPHLEEAYWFGEGVLPLLKQKGVA